MSECKYKTTILSMSVHAESINPVFGDGSTHISLDDLGAGPFIRIKNTHFEEAEIGEVSLDIEELDAVYAAAKQLMAQYGESCERISPSL